jgi:hypothetical protein
MCPARLRLLIFKQFLVMWLSYMANEVFSVAKLRTVMIKSTLIVLLFYISLFFEVVTIIVKSQ